MFRSRFARQTVQRLRPGNVVERDEEVDDWSNPVRVPISGCALHPGNGSRDTDHRDGVMAAFTIVLPAGTDARGDDRWELPGLSGQFVTLGEPLRYEHGMSTDHVAVAVQRWEG